MPLSLEVVTENLSSDRVHVFPEFEADSRFNESWWHGGSAKSPVSFCSFLEDDQEIGRAKIIPGSRSYEGYTTWACPREGATEIDLIEIRPDLRRSDKHYGRKAVDAIGRVYGLPAIALSLNESSNGFWGSIGWIAHTNPESDRNQTLFSSE